MKKRIKIAYIGGGSKMWARIFMSDLALTDDLSGEIALYDIDKPAAIRNAKISKYINSINFEVSEKELKAYVLSIVANESKNAIDEYKYFDDIDSHEDVLSDDDFFERIEIKETYDMVIEQIKHMDEKYSITLLFHYSEDMSVKEIADLMGISEKTVYTRITRGKRLLLELISEVI
jgi:RNA polymerase sigma factor (sigma-70 family)